MNFKDNTLITTTEYRPTVRPLAGTGLVEDLIGSESSGCSFEVMVVQWCPDEARCRRRGTGDAAEQSSGCAR
ncbi:hypothetical protein M0R45_002511 [Rubus argutus]|uniref:Uncharacterized protein n=1 Tax=Rubus argutus TaxID=59490 RepID=A0AAW1VPP6_RUBAR